MRAVFYERGTPVNTQTLNPKPFTVHGGQGVRALQCGSLCVFVSTPGCPVHVQLYRGTSLIRNSHLLGPYSTTLCRAVVALGGGGFL